MMGGCSGGSGQVLELELLTILGDVQDDPTAVQGRWRVAGTGEKPEPMTQEEADKINEMMSLPYLQGSREAPDVVDVTIHDPDKAYQGVNLYNSGNAPAAYAIDMDGKLLHTWQYRVEDVWPDVPATIHSTFWRRVHWYANGNILAIFEGIGLLKLDMDSKLLWSFKGGCHHQAYVLPSGDIYVLTRRAGVLPRINPERPVLVDWITILNRDGSVQREISILECFENSKYKTMLDGLRKRGDIFHANSILVLDSRATGVFSVLRKGNLMISLLKLDAVIVIDPREEKVLWVVSGQRNKYWKRQHDPRMLPNSDMLLFDNIGKQGKSKVLQY
ncbi:MAG: aryl-sulfate sulfotransferase, partial [bacterium]|nr:aryl-sulfate sulfotransferase [bacterium]